jgi:hypothetical protein
VRRRFNLEQFETGKNDLPGHKPTARPHIKTVDSPSNIPGRRRRRGGTKPFETKWAKLPRSWKEALRGCSGAAYELAHAILFEDFKQRHRIKGEIALSAQVTGIQSSTTRHRATQELVKIGIIRVCKGSDKAAPRVELVSIQEPLDDL